MKAISKDDLIIVLNAVKDRSTLDLDDLETILDRFGDEYFVADGEFVKTTENQEMVAVRNVEELQQKIEDNKSKDDILELLRAHDIKLDISCDHELMRYVITIMKYVNNREYKISYSCPYHMYDMLQDSAKVDHVKGAILTMIKLLNERIEKWPDEDTEIIYDYDKYSILA